MDSNTSLPKSLLVPIEVGYIVFSMHSKGYQCFVVGGAVRDLLQERDHIADFDFTTNATPEQILEVFTEAFYENDYGTVSLPVPEIWKLISNALPDDQMAQRLLPESKNNGTRIIDLSKATKVHISLEAKNSKKDEDDAQPIAPKWSSLLKNFEITTYRSDGSYQDHRRPEQVSWGTDILQDLERRDFTINAMALDLDAHFLQDIFASNPDLSHVSETLMIELPESVYTVVDPFEGQKDLKNLLIKTVGTPSERFEEDALRMLRAIRFAVQLKATIEPQTLLAITNHAPLLEHVSWERISTEFLKMLASSQPKRAIELLDETNLLQIVLPELLECKNVEQGGHHTTDVWTHSLDALENSPSADPIVRLATLLHDIAKPKTYKIINGQPTFYNHEIIGSRIAKKVGQRFKLSKKNIDRLFILVRFHMFHYQEQNTDASIRRFMRNVGLEHLDDILDLREGDRLGSGARKTSWRLEEMKERMIEQLHQPMDVTDLAINGSDLMREFSLTPGPILGIILEDLLQIVLNDPEKNTPESLYELAKKTIEAETAVD
ncbi:MAG: HD domain-containing protein [Microgenomates group bacterium]